jgi:hypothetical protein
MKPPVENLKSIAEIYGSQYVIDRPLKQIERIRIKGGLNDMTHESKKKYNRRTCNNPQPRSKDKVDERFTSANNGLNRRTSVGSRYDRAQDENIYKNVHEKQGDS